MTLSVDVDVYGNCLGGGIVRNTTGSGEAGYGRRVSRFCIEIVYPIWEHFAGSAEDFALRFRVEHCSSFSNRYKNLLG